MLMNVSPENDLYDLSPFPVFVFIEISRVRMYEITANYRYINSIYILILNVQPFRLINFADR